MPQPSSVTRMRIGSPPSTPTRHRAAGAARLDRVQQQVDQRVLQLGLVGAHVQPRRRRSTLDRARRGRAPSARSAAPTADTVAGRSTMSPGDGLAARQAQEVLGDAAAAQDLLARDRRALSPTLRPFRRSRRRGLGVAQDALDAGQHRASGVFSSCEKPGGEHARARPAGATRPGAPRPRAARRCRARPRRPAAARRPRRGSATRAPPPTPRCRPASAARRCGPAARRIAGSSVGQSPTSHSRRTPTSRQQQPSTCVARCVRCAAGTRRWPRSPCAAASSTTMPSSMLLMTVSSRSRCRAHLADQAGHRVGHRVELARQPGDRVGALGRHAPFEVARRRSAAPSSRSAAAGAARRRGRRRAMAPTSSSVRPPCRATIQRRSRFIDGADLAGVEVEDQDAVDPVRRVVAAVARLAVADRDHRAQDRPAARLDHPARVRAAPAGTGGRPGRWASRVAKSSPAPAAPLE